MGGALGSRGVEPAANGELAPGSGPRWCCRALRCSIRPSDSARVTGNAPSTYLFLSSVRSRRSKRAACLPFERLGMPLKRGASEVERHNACSALRGLFFCTAYCNIKSLISYTAAKNVWPDAVFCHVGMDGRRPRLLWGVPGAYLYGDIV